MAVMEFSTWLHMHYRLGMRRTNNFHKFYNIKEIQQEIAKFEDYYNSENKA